MLRLALTAVLLHCCFVPMATSAPVEITVDGTNIFPENITSTPDGTVFVGSMVTPVIYRALPGAATAEPWIHFTGDMIGTSWGVLADTASHSLWACVVEHPANTPQPPSGPQRHSSLRVFDLTSGVMKARYVLPGVTNSCNDIAIGPDHTVYISDPPNSRVLRLKPGAVTLEVLIQDAHLMGVDGITFIGPTLYVNSVSSGRIFRIPLADNGTASAPVEVQLSQPLSGPDGMRVWNGRMYVAENRANQVSVLDFQGDTAKVTVLKTGYQTPTGVSPVGDTLWVEESKQNYWRDPALQGENPNPFKIYAIPIPK
jgi:hypothetical protein